MVTDYYDNRDIPCYKCDPLSSIEACPSVAIRWKYKFGFTNAVFVESIDTDPPHSETGWWRNGTYTEYWDLYDTTASGPPVLVDSQTKGYDWAAVGDDVVEDIGDVNIQYTYFDDKYPAGPNQFWILDTSELTNLTNKIDKSIVVDFITDLEEKPWVETVNLPGALFPYVSGYEADDSGGQALRGEWKPNIIPNGLFDEPPTAFINPWVNGTPGSLSSDFDVGDLAAGPLATSSQTCTWNTEGFWDREFSALPFGEGTEGFAETSEDSECHEVGAIYSASS